MESCFPNYFNYFSSSRMHISLPTVTSTGQATYRADDRTTNRKTTNFPSHRCCCCHRHIVPNPIGKTGYPIRHRIIFIQRNNMSKGVPCFFERICQHLVWNLRSVVFSHPSCRLPLRPMALSQRRIDLF
jgi:hypothetical protein